MRSGASRRTGWFALASLICLAAAGFVFLANLEDPPPIPGVGLFRVTVESDEGDDGNPALDSAVLEIPAIEVETKVVSLQKNSDGTLETPTDYDDAGWWSGGPRPGDRGAAVITGHVDSVRSGAAVFHRLGELKRGDTVWYTSRRGERVEFEVESSERYDKDALPTKRVYGRTDGSRLRLITCTGPFDIAQGLYRDNLVVYARRA